MADTIMSIPEDEKASNVGPVSNGSERVKKLFTSSDSELYQNASLATGVASLLGFTIGGKLGGNSSGTDHILANQLTPYRGKMVAHRAYHSAVLKGFIRNGSRWGWRAGLFAGLYSAVMTIVAEYRNKQDGINVIVAGAATGATYKMLSGFRGIIVGTVLGSLFSLPIAAGAEALFWIVPEDFKESIRQLENEKKEKKKNKAEPWKTNLEVTKNMIEQMETELESTFGDKEDAKK
ncbi:complex I assembly factor TIMMDC1, mitochondrial-like [Rhopilema esculentum]|uniref:complex I assembly factor TIMMDC1, mitochondrial-like n=1 Tax=Rhopilema esculentum TaxID=499914 RepID=UPI0031E2578A